MSEERKPEGETTESTERIPPGSMPPDDADTGEGDDAKREPRETSDDERADEDSKDSFPASDPPAW